MSAYFGQDELFMAMAFDTQVIGGAKVRKSLNTKGQILDLIRSYEHAKWICKKYRRVNKGSDVEIWRWMPPAPHSPDELGYWYRVY